MQEKVGTGSEVPRMIGAKGNIIGDCVIALMDVLFSLSWRGARSQLEESTPEKANATMKDATSISTLRAPLPVCDRFTSVILVGWERRWWWQG